MGKIGYQIIFPLLRVFGYFILVDQIDFGLIHLFFNFFERVGKFNQPVITAVNPSVASETSCRYAKGFRQK